MVDITKKNRDFLLDDLIKEERNIKNGNSDLYHPIEIEVFIGENSFFRMISSFILADITHIKKITQEKAYLYHQNGKDYQFRCFSDFPLLIGDQKILQNVKKRYQLGMLRSIKIALSKKLSSARLITTLEISEKTSYLNLLVEYEKEKKKYIIDYSRNLVMEKKDYNELYLPKELQILTQGDLYLLMNKIENLGRSMDSSFLFLFGNELLNDPRFGVGKYDKNGVHRGNYFVLDDEKNYSSFDCELSPMDLEIQEFTENPQKFGKNITYSKDRGCYFYKKTPFQLLSDMVGEKTKEVLLSKNRYKHCHQNSLSLVYTLKGRGISAQLVSGMEKMNDFEKLDHTIVETEDEVMDFNRNLVMKKEDYYQMTGFVVINRSDQELLSKNMELLDSYGIRIQSKTFGYLSQEFNRDLVRNKHLFKKKS